MYFEVCPKSCWKEYVFCSCWMGQSTSLLNLVDVQYIIILPFIKTYFTYLCVCMCMHKYVSMCVCVQGVLWIQLLWVVAHIGKNFQWYNCLQDPHALVSNHSPMTFSIIPISSLVHQARLGWNHFSGLLSVPHVDWVDIWSRLPKQSNNTQLTPAHQDQRWVEGEQLSNSVVKDETGNRGWFV